MTDPLTRAKQLVALATNPGASLEEARSVALKACKHIAEHKLLERMAEAPLPPGFTGVHFEGQAVGADELQSLFRMMQDLMRGSRRERERPPSPPAANPGTGVRRPGWVSESEWNARVEAELRELRRRTSSAVPEPTLRRAAEAAVYLACEGERERHQGRKAKR